MADMVARRERRTHAGTLAVVFLLGLVLIVYMGWAPRTFSESEDTLTFAIHVAGDKPVFHPNHLIFEHLHWVFSLSLGKILPDVPVIVRMNILTVAFSLLALSQIHRLVSRRQGSRMASLATILVAGSFGFWHYSVSPDAYIPALSLALLAIAFLDRRASSLTGAGIVTLAALMSAAVLVHQLYVFLSILMAILLLGGAAGARAGVVRAGLFILTGAVLVGSAYVLAFIQSASGWTGWAPLLEWARGHASGGLWSPPSALTPFFGMVGFGTAIISPNPIFAIPSLAESLDVLADGRSVMEESFAAGTLSETSAMALVFLACLTGGLLVWLALKGSLAWARRSRTDRTDLLLLSGAVLYALLALTWEAINKEFWIHVFVFLSIFLCRQGPRDTGTPVLLALSALCLGVTNFLGAIRPYSDPAQDYWRQMTAGIISIAEPGDLVIVQCPWLCARYVEFLGDVTVVPVNPASVPLVAATDAVLLSSWVLEPPFPETEGERQARLRFLSRLREETGYPLPRHARPGEQRFWRSAEGGWWEITPERQ